ncbi:MAG: RHS repeat-associated core domain-containing protein, partial [Planctomycetes bacterium]|nr:RHS repeat-associated core domain-containing protein [Planctomycetota bacterium]
MLYQLSYLTSFNVHLILRSYCTASSGGSAFGFGKIVTETAPTERGRYAFTGRVRDDDVEMQGHHARWYDYTIGKWISQDPLGFDAGDSNLYRYVNNQVTVTTDASGFQPGFNSFYENGTKTRVKKSGSVGEFALENFKKDDAEKLEKQVKLVAKLAQRFSGELGAAVAFPKAKKYGFEELRPRLDKWFEGEDRKLRPVDYSLISQTFHRIATGLNNGSVRVFERGVHCFTRSGTKRPQSEATFSPTSKANVPCSRPRFLSRLRCLAST